MATNSGNPHEINAYNVGRVAYSVEALEIVAKNIGAAYKVPPEGVFLKMLTVLEEGFHPLPAGIKFALERKAKIDGAARKVEVIAAAPKLPERKTANPDDFDAPDDMPYTHDY